MTRAKLLLPLLSLPMLACAAEAQDRGSDEVGRALCPLGYHAIPMTATKSGHHVAPVTVNNVPGTFVIDTGAGVSVIHAPLADRFGLKPQKGFVRGVAVGAGGSTSASILSASPITVGGMAVGERRLFSTDLGQAVAALKQLSGTDVQGIIGQDILRAEHAVVDVRSSVLYLQADGPKPAC